jgi:hypothetical protein
MKLKTISLFSILTIICLLTSCIKRKSVYLKNNTKADLEIIYDDRVYRSQLDTTRTLTKYILKRDSTFFIAPDSSISNIFPDYLQINLASDTILLIGRRAIKSMINEEGNGKCFIIIN